jgi:hypothetical protein
MPLLPGPEPAASPTTTSTSSNAGASQGVNISINWNYKSQHALKKSIHRNGDEWYHKRGKIINKSIGGGWAETILDCREVIRFDAVLCTSPRHQNSGAFGKITFPPTSDTAGGVPWAVATFALGGCASCGEAPEGFTVYGGSPDECLPLLAPLSIHSSNVKTACRPQASVPGHDGQPKFVPRCLECIRDRFCFSCDQWWCESCYQIPGRDELSAAHQVHIVDDANGLLDHEMAAPEQPKIKVRLGYCIECNIKDLERKKASRRHELPEVVDASP